MSKTRKQLAGDTRAKAAIEHLLQAVEVLNAACRDLCSVKGAATHYRTIAKLSDAARACVDEINLDYARSTGHNHPYELQHEPSDREIDETHFACGEIAAEATAQTFIDRLFTGIEHGDDEHRVWLRKELQAWVPKLVQVLKGEAWS